MIDIVKVAVWVLLVITVVVAQSRWDDLFIWWEVVVVVRESTCEKVWEMQEELKDNCF